MQSSLGRHGMGAFHLPVGGMGAFADAVTKSAKASGVEIRTSAKVDHVLIENDTAVGVVLTNGDEIRAPIVASSADPQATLLKLIQPGNLDAQFLKRIRHLRMNGCVAKVHLALDGLPDSWAKSAGRDCATGSLPSRAARLRNCGLAFGSSSRTANSRATTRSTLPSTGTAGTPKAIALTAAAV